MLVDQHLNNRQLDDSCASYDQDRLTKSIYIKLENESRNKTIHSALFSPHNPFDGNYSHSFNDFIGRVHRGTHL